MLPDTPWPLGDGVKVADTATSTVWRAESAEHGSVALKALKPAGHEEQTGALWLRWRGGRGAVRLLGVRRNLVLTEWAPGAPIGDMVRAGLDRAACLMIGGLVDGLHAPGPTAPLGLTPLHLRFARLTEAGYDAFPGEVRIHGMAAAALARAMLNRRVPPMPLHGDLHHDNVLGSPRGWLAIDPKGLMGDPAYDFANCFRNPVCCPALVLDPARIRHMAEAMAGQAHLSPQRLLSWAAAHSALSILWALDDGRDPAHDIALLPRLLSVLHQH